MSHPYSGEAIDLRIIQGVHNVWTHQGDENCVKRMNICITNDGKHSEGVI